MVNATNKSIPMGKPPPTVVCEDEDIRRQSRLDEVMRVGPWSNGIGVLINEGKTPELSSLLSVFVQRKALESNRKVAFGKPESEPSPETESVRNFILNF